MSATIAAHGREGPSLRAGVLPAQGPGQAELPGCAAALPPETAVRPIQPHERELGDRGAPRRVSVPGSEGGPGLSLAMGSPGCPPAAGVVAGKKPLLLSLLSPVSPGPPGPGPVADADPAVPLRQLPAASAGKQLRVHPHPAGRPLGHKDTVSFALGGACRVHPGRVWGWGLCPQPRQPASAWRKVPRPLQTCVWTGVRPSGGGRGLPSGNPP